MLVRYTRCARTIYSLCSYDILASLVRYALRARYACLRKREKDLFNAYTVGGFLEKPLKNLSKKYVQIEISML